MQLINSPAEAIRLLGKQLHLKATPGVSKTVVAIGLKEAWIQTTPPHRQGIPPSCITYQRLAEAYDETPDHTLP